MTIVFCLVVSAQYWQVVSESGYGDRLKWVDYGLYIKSLHDNDSR